LTQKRTVKGRLLIIGFDMAQTSCWFCSYEHIKAGWKEHRNQAKTFLSDCCAGSEQKNTAAHEGEGTH